MYSVAGTGVNVNQRQFASYSPPATSLLMETGEHFPLEKPLESLCAAMNKWYSILKREDSKRIRAEYLSFLFGFKQRRSFAASGGVFEAVIEGVRDDGKLSLRRDSGVIHAGFKEVSYIF
jgi:BirA family biotin operon repressor/biotin-[acetyl-CoA-carboxylase] ligase